MKFLKEYKQIRDNYCSLTQMDKFIVWTRFKVTALEKIMELIPEKGKLLDLGCGFGVFCYLLAFKYPQLNVIGVDPASDRIKLANDVFLKPQKCKILSRRN